MCRWRAPCNIGVLSPASGIPQALCKADPVAEFRHWIVEREVIVQRARYRHQLSRERLQFPRVCSRITDGRAFPHFNQMTKVSQKPAAAKADPVIEDRR